MALTFRKVVQSLMIYKKEPFCEVQNNFIEDIKGTDLAEIVAVHGFVKISNIKNSWDEIKEWKYSIGYYKNNVHSTICYNKLSSPLIFYPDNEELLLIYNNSNKDIEIEISNTCSINDSAKFKIRDWYDDLWALVESPFTSNIYYRKHITESINFDPKNFKNYKQMRTGESHMLKIVPRHPLRTNCFFFPYEYVKGLFEFAKHPIKNYGENVFGLAQKAINSKRYTIKIRTNDAILIDNIICQYRFKDSVRDIQLVPLWYKTNQRKHFNYSI